MSMRWTAGAVLVAAALLIGAGEARAQSACASPTDVPEELYLFYVDQLDALPLQGPDACSKLTKGAVSTCHKTVSSMIKCYQSIYRSTFKAQQIKCGATVDPKQCTADHKSLLELTLDQIDAASDDLHTECDEQFAEAIYFACLAI